ncbi:MAG: hypothetical protein GC159_18480 [Phycisphaera sp.]|nr:hypothetical protein [Phycisphaera sp.]
MGSTASQVDGYIRKNKRWGDELAALRRIVLASGLTEDIKWRAPCYTLDGANVVMLGAFIAILGLFQGNGHREVLSTLGRHDEFTLFCAVGLSNTDRGWTPDRRKYLLDLTESLMERDSWFEVVRKALESDDEVMFTAANFAANKLGIETWQYVRKRLGENPHDAGRWYDVMQQCNEDRIAEIITLAETALPLDKLSAGPSKSLGIGPDFQLHSCLDSIVSNLGSYPGHGEKLIRASLRSPVTRNRNEALWALSEWGKEKWPDGMEATLRQAIKQEPDESVKNWMQEVIEGKPLD